MPIYEYRCLTCGKEVEVMQGLTEGPPTCECGGKMERIISRIGTIIFKGPGWWATRNKCESCNKSCDINNEQE